MLGRGLALACLALAAVVGLAGGRVWLAVVALSVLASWGLSKFYMRRFPAGVTVHRRAEREVVPWGATVQYVVSISNRKWLPLLRFRLSDEIPRAVEVTGGRKTVSYRIGRANLEQELSLGPYQRAELRFTLTNLERGAHVFGPTLIHSAGLYGDAPVDLELGEPMRIVVWPKVIAVDGLSWERVGDDGVRSRQNWVRQDPLHIVGLRPYANGDPARLIDRNVWARTGAPASRLLGGALERQVWLVVDLTTAERPWDGIDRPLAERTLSVAASLAARAAADGTQLGLLVNAPVTGVVRWVEIGCGAGRAHLEAILTALGAVQPQPSIELPALFDRVSSASESMVIMVAGRMTGALEQASQLLSRRQTTHSVVLMDALAHCDLRPYGGRVYVATLAGEDADRCQLREIVAH